MSAAVEGRDHHRFLGACAAGFLTAGTLLTLLIAGPDGDLFRGEPLGAFYETQARAWAHGHWNVPPAGDVLYEAFVIHGKNFLYFGPWPALLRLPVVALTHSLDGRMTSVSMLLAFAVFAVFATKFAWLSRGLLRGGAPVGRLETVGTAVLTFLLAAGSSIFFLASRSIVYHEAILWGVAFATAGLFYTTRFALDGRPRTLVFATSVTTLAVLSRVSVGLAAVAALVLVAAARVVSGLTRGRATAPKPPSALGRKLGWPGVSDNTRAVGLGWLVMSFVLPLALYAYINITKFGSAFALPLNKQFLVTVDPTRRAALHANPLTGLRFVPTTLVQYLRPDAIRFDRLFPWVTFPGPPRVFGSAHFATLDVTSSVTASMTALFVLWIVGVVAIFRTVRADDMRPTVLRIPLLAGLCGCVGVLTFGFIANRYMGDFIPELAVGAVIGFHVCARWAATGGVRRGVVRMAIAGLSVLVVWTCGVQLGLALQYQRAYGIMVSDATRAGWIGLQLDVHDHLPGGSPSNVARAPTVPAVGPNGQLLIVGSCAGLDWSDGRQWHAVERTPSTGRIHLRVVFPAASPGTVESLVATGTRSEAGLVLVRYLAGGRVALQYSPSSGGTLTEHYVGSVERVEPGRSYDVEVTIDPLGPVVEAFVDGRQVLNVSLGVQVLGGPATLGRDPTGASGAGTFGGQLRSLATPTPLCDRLQRSLVGHRPQAKQ